MERSCRRASLWVPPNIAGVEVERDFPLLRHETASSTGLLGNASGLTLTWAGRKNMKFTPPASCWVHCSLNSVPALP